MIRKCYKFYTLIMTLMWVMAAMTASAFAVDDMWTVANRIIVDVYTKIVGISTVLAGLMSAVAVIGAKISNNQLYGDNVFEKCGINRDGAGEVGKPRYFNGKRHF
mgnify:CR=1 FL=1